MLKNLEIINELHERLIEKGFVELKDKSEYFAFLNMKSSLLIHIYTGKCSITKYIKYDVKCNQWSHTEENFIIYNLSESDCMSKILNKVDEWMGNA